MTGKKEHKLLTNIIKDSFKKSPKTTHNLITYHYDFNEKQYLIYNPDNYKFSTQFPKPKIDLVCHDIKANIKKFPKARYTREFQFLNIVILLIYLVALSFYFGKIIFSSETELNKQIQYLYSYLIMVVIGILTAYLIFLHNRVIYKAKLYSKKRIMSKLFEEINMVDFPKGDIQLKTGEHGVWFSIKILDSKIYMLPDSKFKPGIFDNLDESGGSRRHKATAEKSLML